MRRAVSLALGTVLLAALTLAAPQAPKKEGSIRCTLTNKVIEKQEYHKFSCTLEQLKEIMATFGNFKITEKNWWVEFRAENPIRRTMFW